MFIAIVVLWYASWRYLVPALVALAEDTPAPEAAGQLGDSFGAVNALFAGLALGGVIFTLVLQSKELRLQREEFMEMSAAMNKQHEVLQQTLEVEEAARRRAQTMKLFEEWVSCSEERGVVEQWLHDHNIKGMIRFDNLRPGADNGFDREVVQANTRPALLRINSFFVHWAAFHTAGEVDNELMQKLMGEAAEWWRDVYARWVIDTTADKPLRRTMAYVRDRVLCYDAAAYRLDSRDQAAS